MKFYLFADDTNLLYTDKNLKSLESTVNVQFFRVYNWLIANSLSLKIKTSNLSFLDQDKKKLNLFFLVFELSRSASSSFILFNDFYVPNKLCVPRVTLPLSVLVLYTSLIGFLYTSLIGFLGLPCLIFFLNFICIFCVFWQNDNKTINTRSQLDSIWPS